MYFLEYEHLNKTLDEIDSWMNTLESRNDSLYSQLQELLKSSKETRQEFQMMNECQENNGKTDGDKTNSWWIQIGLVYQYFTATN